MKPITSVTPARSWNGLRKLGKDVRIIRALALALGKTRALQSDNMFAGISAAVFQRSGGLPMEMCTCRGSLFVGNRYAPPTRPADELAATEYAKTEDALFVLSLFDDQEEGYRTMHSQLLRLLGKNARFPCLKTAAC
ncbi:MAG: hypothetical protein ACLRJV_14495 [Eubacteriales bacterium]